MPRIEYDPKPVPARPDRIAPGDRARREQNRRRKESDRRQAVGCKREHEDADKDDRDANGRGPGKRVDLEA